MDVNDFIAQLKGVLIIEKNRGNEQIPADSIIQYLDNFPTTQQPTEIQLEIVRNQLRTSADFARHKHESNLEMFRSVISAGQAAIRTLFLLSGGAAVALLAFIGHLATNAPSRIAPFVGALVPFTTSVFLAGALAAITYLSQWLYGYKRTEKAGFCLNLLAIALGLGVLGTFIWGMIETHSAFGSFQVQEVVDDVSAAEPMRLNGLPELGSESVNHDLEPETSVEAPSNPPAAPVVNIQPE